MFLALKSEHITSMEILIMMSCSGWGEHYDPLQAPNHTNDIIQGFSFNIFSSILELPNVLLCIM